jgi:predicted O-methyltransferase YrrM
VGGGLSGRLIWDGGSGLGYATLWLAYGAKRAEIDTIERDPLHCALAREHFEDFGIAERVRLHQGEFAEILPSLQPHYDLALFDGFAPELRFLEQFARLLRPAGVLISSNLLDSRYLNGEPTEAIAYGERLWEAPWQSSLLDDNTIVSVKASC